MIEGVKMKQLKILPDDRGFITEIIKGGEETFAEIKQTTYSETYPGAIKAFHWHKKQTDIWFVASGMAQVVLYDLREDSPTHGQTDIFYLGEQNRAALLIPPGVAHGYRVLGIKPVKLFYHTDQTYDPQNPDEERIAFDDPTIGFDWNTRNR
jgi:dTDP-4-dehydrorhamnose 3,5-epimerase